MFHGLRTCSFVVADLAAARGANTVVLQGPMRETAVRDGRPGRKLGAWALWIPGD